MSFNARRILVTGGTGLIGRALVDLLVAQGARVTVVSLDSALARYLPPGVEFLDINLRTWPNCCTAVEGMEDVFHLAGIKGSVGIGVSRAASFMVPALLMNTHLMEAARTHGVERYLFTSSVAVYPPAEVFREDEAWSGEPHPSDRYAAYAKRVGELQALAYREEFGWGNVAIVRPSNIYGPWDNFHPHSAMVVAALIHRAVSGENPLVVWGDGSNVRDFLYSEDAARGMMLALEHSANCTPFNLGSGQGVSIRQLVEAILNCLPHPPEVQWDTTRAAGERVRIMDISRAQKLLGWTPQVDLQEGVRRTVEWYVRNSHLLKGRYNIFKDRDFNASQAVGGTREL